MTGRGTVKFGVARGVIVGVEGLGVTNAGAAGVEFPGMVDDGFVGFRGLVGFVPGMLGRGAVPPVPPVPGLTPPVPPGA